MSRAASRWPLCRVGESPSGARPQLITSRFAATPEQRWMLKFDQLLQVALLLTVLPGSWGPAQHTEGSAFLGTFVKPCQTSGLAALQSTLLCCIMPSFCFCIIYTSSMHGVLLHESVVLWSKNPVAQEPCTALQVRRVKKDEVLESQDDSQ